MAEGKAIAVPRGEEAEELGVLWPFANRGPISVAVRDDVTIPFLDDEGRLGTIDLFAMDWSAVRISGPREAVVAALESMLAAARSPLPFDPTYGIPQAADDEGENGNDHPGATPEDRE